MFEKKATTKKATLIKSTTPTADPKRFISHTGHFMADVTHCFHMLTSVHLCQSSHTPCGRNVYTALFRLWTLTATLDPPSCPNQTSHTHIISASLKIYTQ